jgi:hypothetical protein
MPGDTVTITGTGWFSGETVRLHIDEAPATHEPHELSAVADAAGVIVNRDLVIDEHDLGVTFTLIATGDSSGYSAQAVFTDNRTITKAELQNPTTSAFVTLTQPPASPVQVSVAANATVSTRITATTDATGTGAAWQSTEWVVDNGSGTVLTSGCDNGVNVTTATPGTLHTFNLTAPGTSGTYRLRFRAFRLDGCAGSGPSSQENYANSLVVVASNQVPTAVPGGPYPGTEQSPITLNGNGSSDPDGTIATYTWRVVSFSNLAGQCTFANNPGPTPSVTCDDNGTLIVGLTVTDNGGANSPEVEATVTVNNVAPTATFAAESPVNEGSSFKLQLTNADDVSPVDDAAGLAFAFDCGDGLGYSSFGATPERSCPTTDNGSRSVSGKVRDKDGGESEYTGTVNVINVRPSATFEYPPADVPEGTSFTLALTSPTDPSSADVTAGFRYAFDCGDPNSPVLPVTYATAGTDTSITCGTTDDAVRTVKGRIFDKDDGYTTYTQTVTVVNVEPSVSLPASFDYSVWAITAMAFDMPGFVTASFTDPGTADTHTCTINWGEGTTNAGTMLESSGSGTCSSVAGNKYSDNGAGIYDISVEVTDDDGGKGSASATIIVYDPSAGFVTGGGWINSLAGYCKKAGCLDAEGKAHFGFVSKYQKGASVPTGQTEFQFQAGNLNFHSGSYEWLIVNNQGTNAQYKGTGTINGANDANGNPYKFMLWGYDGTKVGGSDTFRIRIWSEVNGYEDVVYDNGGSGTGGYSNAAIASGSIQVQTGSKK